MINPNDIRPVAQSADLELDSMIDNSPCQKTVTIRGRKFKLASPQDFLKHYGFAIGTLLEGPDQREVKAVGMIKENRVLVVYSSEGKKKVLLENIQLPEDLRNEGYEWDKSIAVTKRKREEENHDSLQVAERVSRFFLSHQECDVFFLIEGQRIGGRAADLSRESQYFRALLQGGFKEKISQDNQQAKEIPLEDCSTEEFQLLLQYVSTGHLLINEENLLVLFNLADRFGVDTLKRQCQERLPSLLSPTLALSYFQVLFGKECFLNPYLYNYIYQHRSAIFKEDEKTVVKLSKEQLIFLITHAPPEIQPDFFEAALIWLSHAKERKTRFRSFLAEIFPLFPQEVGKLEKCSKALSRKDQFFERQKTLFKTQASQNLPLLCIYARALCHRDQYEQAATIFEKLLMKEPKHLFALIGYASALYGLDQIPQAKAKYEEALALEPKNCLALIGYAETLGPLGQLDQAKATYEEALVLEPKNPSALFGYAEILLLLYQFDQAKEKFEEALALEPKNPSTLRCYAENLRLLGLVDEAKKKFKEALVLDPQHPFALTGYAETLGQLGQLDQAKEKFKEVLTLVPKDLFALRGYANILLKLLQFPEAKEKFEEALAINPKDLFALRGYAATLRHLGQIAQAKEKYEEVLAIDPTDDFARIGYTATLRQLAQHPEIEERN
jgi:tetratricopeptide (TPR) repeat protein